MNERLRFSNDRIDTGSDYLLVEHCKFGDLFNLVKSYGKLPD